ncbi:LWXIA domain-containing protein [Paraburkholderia sp. Tr-20389]|uniref:LWXIA domain-containing protein n=1 Tax=Paraburkholderia sp. Tr-20389 TaxID=2703903 RepID=UPI00197DD68D|nr:LWXIA domain-containing protein [Paraburkholderia sp. Tr-20389]MBN3753603.1 LWXIA domain-containing protein [Paraburkholderia sp. Tr-20389]
MSLMAVDGGGSTYVPPPSNPDKPKPANTGANGSNAAPTAQQQALAAAKAETARLLKIAQQEMATLQRLRNQGAKQADIDAQIKKAGQAWGAVQAAAENQMRVSADGGGDAKKAISSAAADVRALDKDDPILDEVVTDSQNTVTPETAVQRTTNEKAFQFALAAQTDQDATDKVNAYNAETPAQQQADGEEYAYSIRQDKSTADTGANNAYDALEKALRHEYSVEAATLRLHDANADYAAWQKEPSGARRADEADAAQELSQAQTQYDKVTAGDDSALDYVTADEQKQAVATVKNQHPDAWYGSVVDMLGQQSALKRDISLVNPDDPSLSPQMKQLAQNDPVTFALLQETGQTIDPNAPGLSPKEKELAQQNPLALAFVRMTGVNVDPAKMTPTEKKQLDQLGLFQYACAHADPKSAGVQKMQMLMAAAPDVRLQYTKQQVDLLMQDPGHNASAALKVLNTNMNATFSISDREQMWNEAGLPHFNQKYVESQIDPLMVKPDTTANDPDSVRARNDSTMNADKVGKWMQATLDMNDVPPEFAGVVIDTVKHDFSDKWMQSNTGTPAIERGTDFYKGLSQAVSLADLQPTDTGVPVARENDVASWLMNEDGNAKSMIYTLRGDSTSYGFDSVRDTVSGGYGPALSQALLKQMQGDDRFKSGFANDFQLMLSQGMEKAQSKVDSANADASYKIFQTDPSKVLQPYFDDFQQHFDNQPHTFDAGSSQLTNFVGVGLGMQPDDPSVIPTDNQDNPSMGMLEQLIVNNVAFNQGKSLFASNGNATKMINTVTDQIRKVGGDHAVVTLVPTYYVSKDSGASPSALFKVQVNGRPGEFKYIDDRGWSYDKLDDYQHNNGLSDSATLYVPKNLTLGAASSGPAQYDSVAAHITSGWQHVEHVLEIGTGILAAVGGVVLVASGVGAVEGGLLLGAAWTAVGAGMAVGTGVAVQDLVNLNDHGQSLGFGNAQARSDWISLIGSGAGVFGGGLGMASKSLMESAALLRSVDEASGALSTVSRTSGDAALVGNSGRFAETANAFEGTAAVTSRAASIFNVVGGLSGADLSLEQGTSLLKNWDAMSDSDRIDQLFTFGLGIAQMGAGSKTLMDRPIRTLFNVPDAPRPVTNITFDDADVMNTSRLGTAAIENQRRLNGDFGDPRGRNSNTVNLDGNEHLDGIDAFEADKGLDAKAAAARRVQNGKALGTDAADGDALLVRLAPDAEGDAGTPHVVDPSAADPAAAKQPANVADPQAASWSIPANVRADPVMLEETVVAAFESGSGLDQVEFYIYALQDEEGHARAIDEHGLPATDKGDFVADLHASRNDERRAALASDPQALAAHDADPDTGEPLNLTRYTSLHDALVLGREGTLAGRYGIAMVDRTALAPDGSAPPEAIVGRLVPDAAGTNVNLSLDPAFQGDLRIRYPRAFEPGKPLIRSENGQRIDAVNPLFGRAETQWAAYPRREADLAIYAPDLLRDENQLPNGERPQLPVPPGHFAVYCHAWTDAFSDVHGNPFDAPQMADMIRAAGWDGKSPVILYACGTATRVNPLAQLLASVLGVDVYGASGFVAWRAHADENGRATTGYTSGLVIEPGAYDRMGRVDESVTDAPGMFRFSPELPLLNQHPAAIDWRGEQARPVVNRWGDDGGATASARAPLSVYLWGVLTKRGAIVNPRTGAPASALDLTFALESLTQRGYTPGTPVALDGAASGADPALIQAFSDLIQTPVYGRLGTTDASGWRRVDPNPNRRLARFEIEPDTQGKFSPGGAQPIKLNALELRPVPGTRVVNLLGHEVARQYLKVSGYDIAETHGTKPDNVAEDNTVAVMHDGPRLTAERFVQALMEDDAYTPGNGVLVTGCYLGSGGYPWARDLAYHLQAPVIASITSNSTRGTGALTLHPLEPEIGVPGSDPDVGTRLYLHLPDAPEEGFEPEISRYRREHGIDATTLRPPVEPVEAARPIAGEIDPNEDSGRRGIDGSPDEPSFMTPRALGQGSESADSSALEPVTPEPLEPDAIFTADEWAARNDDNYLSGKTQAHYPTGSKAYTRRDVTADGSGIVTTLAGDRPALMQPGFDDVTGLAATDHPEFLRPADTLLMPPDDPLHAIGARGLMSPPGHHVIFGHGISPDDMLGPHGVPIGVDEVAARVAPLLEDGQDVTLYSCYAGSDKADPLRARRANRGPRVNAAFADALAQRLSDATGRPTTVWAPGDILLVDPNGTVSVRLTRFTGQVERTGTLMTTFRARPAYVRGTRASAGHAVAEEPTPTPAEKPATPQVSDLRLTNAAYDFSPLANDTFDSVSLEHPFADALTSRPGVLSDVARVTRPGGEITLSRPSGLLDEPHPLQALEHTIHALRDAGLTNLRAEFVTLGDASIELGDGVDIGALDPEDGYFRFSGTVPLPDEAASAASEPASASVSDLDYAFASQEPAQHTVKHVYVSADALPDESAIAPDADPRERFEARMQANLDAVAQTTAVQVRTLSSLGYDPAAELHLDTPEGILSKPAGIDMYVVQTRDEATGTTSYCLAAIDENGLPEGYAAVNGNGMRALAMTRRGPLWPVAGAADPAPPTPAARVPDPASTSATAAVAREQRAADWLDEHDLRTLQRIDGAHVPMLSGLVRRLGRNAHVLITEHAAHPGADQEHAQPAFIASLTTDEHGVLSSIEPTQGKSVPRALTKALTGTGDAGIAARRKYDFYVSPVAADDLARFGGPAKIESETMMGKTSWRVTPSGKPVDTAIVGDITELSEALRFRRPSHAAHAADAQQRIYAVEEKTGKVLGYAERNLDHTWTYYEKAKAGDTKIGPQDLSAAFRRRARGIPLGRAGRRGVTFVVSETAPSALDRVGGFRPAEKNEVSVPATSEGANQPETKPRRKSGDVVQLQVARADEAARRTWAHVRGRETASADHPLVEPNLLPSTDSRNLHAVDFSGHNALHLLRAIQQDSIDRNHTIYVFDTKDTLAEAIGKPRGIIAWRDEGLRWFDNVRQANNVNHQGMSLDEMPIGTDRFGANVHFLLTRLTPREFLAVAKPTRLAALTSRAQTLRRQWAATAETGKQNAAFRQRAEQIKASYETVRREADDLRHEMQNSLGTRNRRKSGANLAHVRSPMKIEPYQPGLASTTVIESNLRSGAAKLDQYFPESERIEAFNARMGGPKGQRLIFTGGRQTIMSDAVMWKSLGNDLKVAREVSTSSPRFLPVSRKSLGRKFGAATVADRRMIRYFVRHDAAIQDRIAPMARSFSLRDDPALMTAQIERYGGVMPMVSLVVDPHSLKAALGKPHDPEFLERVRALGDQQHARFDGAKGVIEPGPDSEGDALQLDDLDYLGRWLDEASKSGFAIRLETAPARALVGKDNRFQAGTNDDYHDYVRVFSALEKWANANPDAPAPNVMVTFHGWDAVPESVPGAGHARLLEAVLARKGLEWVHMGLSYGTHGADFIANQDLTTRLAQMIVDYRNAPDVLARLHGADSLTRVFERVDRQTLADQHQLLFAEIERIGGSQGMKPAEIDALRHQLYEGNTTAFLDSARKATIEYARPQWQTGDNAPAGKTERLARAFAQRWMEDTGDALTTTRPATRATANDPAPTAYWRSVVADPVLKNDGTKPLSANRKASAQLGIASREHEGPDGAQPLSEEETSQLRAASELNALRVQQGNADRSSVVKTSLLVGGAGTTTGVAAASAFRLLRQFSAEGTLHATNTLYTGVRVGRVFQAMHQGAVASLKNGDPRVFDQMVDRLANGLKSQLKANRFDVDVRTQQLELLASEGKAKAGQLRALNDAGLISFDDAVTHTKGIAADMLAQMQGVVGGSSLKMLHHGNPRHWVGLMGRGLGIAGYTGTITLNMASMIDHPTLATALSTAGATMGGTYTTLVFLGSIRHLNAENRSRFARFASASGDYLASSGSLIGGATKILSGDVVSGSLSAASGLLLGSARLHTQFPNSSPFMEKLPTLIALLPVGLFVVTTAQGLFFSGSSGQNDKNDPNTPNKNHQNSPQPSPSDTPQPSITASAAPSQPSAQPSGQQPSASNPASQPGSQPSSQPTAKPSSPPPTVVTADGDSLWSIADDHRRTLLDAARVPDADQRHMSHNHLVQLAFDEILQLNPQYAKHPGSIDPGDTIVIG